MKRIIFSSMLSMGIILSQGLAYADAPRPQNTQNIPNTIAIVDVGAVLESSPQMIADQTQLKKQFQPKLDQLKAAEAKLQGLNDQLKKEGPTMQPKDRQALGQTIEAQSQQLSKSEADFQHSVFLAKQQAMQKLLGQLQKVIQNVALKSGYTIVIPKNMALYADSSLDITNQIKQALINNNSNNS